MIACSYYLELRIEDLTEALSVLPEKIRPDKFSSDEVTYTNAKGLISDDARYQAFLGKNGVGFFLLAERARYNINLRQKNGFFSVQVDCLSSETDALKVLSTLAGVGVGAAFAFSSDEDEYLHRNRYTRESLNNAF